MLVAPPGLASDACGLDNPTERKPPGERRTDIGLKMEHRPIMFGAFIYHGRPIVAEHIRRNRQGCRKGRIRKDFVCDCHVFFIGSFRLKL